MNNGAKGKAKIFVAKYFILIVLLVVGLPYIWFTEGLGTAINILNVLVGLFSPLFAVVVLTHIFIGKSTFKDYVLLLLVNICLAIVFFVFLMNNKQRFFLFVFDGIIGFLIVCFFLIRHYIINK